MWIEKDFSKISHPIDRGGSRINQFDTNVILSSCFPRHASTERHLLRREGELGEAEIISIFNLILCAESTQLNCKISTTSLSWELLITIYERKKKNPLPLGWQLPLNRSLSAKVSLSPSCLDLAGLRGGGLWPCSFQRLQKGARRAAAHKKSFLPILEVARTWNGKHWIILIANIQRRRFGWMRRRLSSMWWCFEKLQTCGRDANLPT